MRKKAAWGLAVLATMATSPALAEIDSGNYVGLSYYRESVEGRLAGENYPTDLNKLDSFHVRYGFFLASFLAVEFHGGGSLPSYNSSGRSAVNNYFGAAFGRLNIPFSKKQVNVYALGGVATGQYTADTGTQNVGEISDTKTGPSFGVGIEFYSNKTSGMSVEIYRYLQAEDFRSEGVSVGFVHHFSLAKLLF